MNNVDIILSIKVTVLFNTWVCFGWFKVSFCSCFEKILCYISYIERSGISLSWFFYFTSLLYFSYIILCVLPFSFRTTHSRLAKKLTSIASAQYDYLWMIKNKNWSKRILKITFEKHCSHFIFFVSFHRVLFTFVTISEQQI